MKTIPTELNYFPGCSLATTAKENNASLASFLDHFGIRLREIDDWNCCGSSSTHSVNQGLATSLASRNLFLVPDEKPLLIACPGCFLRLNSARMELEESSRTRDRYAELFGCPFPERIQLLHFFELLTMMSQAGYFADLSSSLKGLRVAPYYGCMLARPPRMNRERNHHGLIEQVIASVGAESVQWPLLNRCCGTFLSVSRPKVAGRLVNRIMQGAQQSGADCIVTACAMCHLNLEIRCSRENQIPVFHFSELLCLALTRDIPKQWLSRHLIDVRPTLEKIELMDRS